MEDTEAAVVSVDVALVVEVEDMAAEVIIILRKKIIFKMASLPTKKS